MYWKSSYTTLGQKVFRYFDNFLIFIFFTSKKLNWNNCGHKSFLDQQAFSLPFLQFNSFYLLAWKLEQFYFCNLTLGVQEKKITISWTLFSANTDQHVPFSCYLPCFHIYCSFPPVGPAYHRITSLFSSVKDKN